MVKIFCCLVRLLWRFVILFKANRPARIHFCRISRSRSIWNVSWLPRRTKRSNWSNFLEMYAVVIALLIFRNCSRAPPGGQMLEIDPVSSIKNSFCNDWPTESVDVLTLLHCHNASTYFLLHWRLSLTLKFSGISDECSSVWTLLPSYSACQSARIPFALLLFFGNISSEFIPIIIFE